jgi:hypothetical protein
MTDARRSNRLQAGDTFHFGKGTNIEVHCSEHGMLRRMVSQHEHFIVLRAEPTNDGAHGKIADWAVWAVPVGTPLNAIQNRTVLLYQEGAYAARALVDVVLIEAAQKRTQYASAKRAA